MEGRVGPDNMRCCNNITVHGIEICSACQLHGGPASQSEVERVPNLARIDSTWNNNKIIRSLSATFRPFLPFYPILPLSLTFCPFSLIFPTTCPFLSLSGIFFPFAPLSTTFCLFLPPSATFYHFLSFSVSLSNKKKFHMPIFLCP